MPYYDDYPDEGTLLTPRRTITEGIATMLIDGGGLIEPQFVDEVTAQETPLGWRGIPGRVTFLLSGGLVTRMDLQRLPGNALAVGVNNVKFTSHVRVGDTLHVEWTVTEKRLSSKKGYGLVRHSEITRNQKGEAVCTADFVHLVELRPGTY